MSFFTGRRTIARAEQYKKVFGTENGKQVLADLLKQLCFDHYPDARQDNDRTLWEINAMHRMAAYIQAQLNMTEADYRKILDAYEHQETEWQTNPPEMSLQAS